MVFKNEEERHSSELQGASGGFGYQARIPLTDLPPGLYVLTLEARSRLGDHPAATRQVPFTHYGAAPAAQVLRVTRCTRSTGCAGCAGRTQAAMRMLDRGTQSNDRRRAAGRRADGGGVERALEAACAASGRRRRSTSAREMVAAVFLGSRPTAGLPFEIVGRGQQAGALVVQYRETKPGADAIAAQVITSPFQLVAMPKADGDVKFEKRLTQLRLLRRSRPARWSLAFAVVVAGFAVVVAVGRRLRRFQLVHLHRLDRPVGVLVLPL